MLHDLLSLEHIFGKGHSAMFIEEILARYDLKDVSHALSSGYLMRRTICLGPDCGRCLCWLSEEGRRVTAQA